MERHKLWVVLPCYNEEENIKDLIEIWQKEKVKLESKSIDLEIIVINDGSTDKTLDVAMQLCRKYENIELINHKKNKGLGVALNSGVNKVLSKQEEGYICTMDGDLTHEPFYIHDMIDKILIEKVDCVIASRYRKNSKVEGLALYRNFLSHCARFIYTFVLRIPNVRDYTCGYRLYTKTAIRNAKNMFGEQLIKEQSFACMVELLYKIHISKNSIGEVPFILKYQLKRGVSKMKIMKTIKRSFKVMFSLKENKGFANI